MPISKDTIVKGFRRFLGREPESDAVIRAHQVFSTDEQLANALTSSEEYILKKTLVGDAAMTHGRLKQDVDCPPRVSTSDSE